MEDNAKESILVQEALFLHDLDVPVFLSDFENKRGIRGTSVYDPVKNREPLVDICGQYPDANLEIAPDKELGTVALGVGVGNWAGGGEESFAELCDIYGTPDTLTYMLPNGETYYLFKVGLNQVIPKVGQGAMFLTGGDSFRAFPSTVEWTP